jgi:hypothetical protein
MKLFIQRLLREPLLHFITIGGLMFAVYAANSEPTETPPDMIVVSADRIEQIKTGFSAVWKREPSKEEVTAMIEEEVRAEVYYRDGIALGLDQNDTIVRRRIRLKMEFMMDNAANAIESTAGELEDFYAANTQDYNTELRLAFEQIYLGARPDQETVTGILGQLATTPDMDPFLLGVHTNLPSQLGYSSEAAVYGVFGKGFFSQLVKLAPNIWAGPVKSTYGLHLVRILDTLPVTTPPLSEVKDEVLMDWKALKRQEIRNLDYERRRKKYTVDIDRTQIQPETSQ